MNIQSLAERILEVARAAAPLVGLDDELEAGLKLAQSIESLVTAVRGLGGSIDETELAALRDRVNAHADKTAASLGPA